MDRALADTIIHVALRLAPERLGEAIATVARSLIESGRYSAEEVDAAIDELLAELERSGPRH